MGHYDEVLSQLKEKGHKLANQYVVELYTILRDEEKLPPEDCRAKIEHDCVDLWSKATIRKCLPTEARDPKKQNAGKIGGENKQKKKKALLVIAGSENVQSTDLEESRPINQNEEDSARTNLAENASINQKEEESRTSFLEEVGRQLSGRTLSPELLEANNIIADRDREIEDLKKDREEMLKEYPVTSASDLLFLPNKLAMEVYHAIRDDLSLSSSSSSSSSSSASASGFNLEHNGEEVTAVYRLDPNGSSNSIGKGVHENWKI
jgi:hypothetical protein